MAIAASAFLTLSLWLAVIIGPQMRMWPWGPALLALAAALACAAIAAIRSKRPVLGPGTLALGTIVTAWFAWRAWASPVAELAHADMLLMAAAVGGFLVVRATSRDPHAEAVFLWGLTALLAASAFMVLQQTGNTEFSQFRSRPVLSGTGFYAHYNEGANFLIGAGFLLMGGAIFGKQHVSIRIIWLLIAILGLAAVWLTRSRGAVFGVIVGFVALAAFILVIGSRRKAAWFAPAMIAFPIILLASGFALYFGWEKVQRLRSDDKQGVVEMMDNTSRLRNYSLAVDAIALNPVIGGGSRSYSWNSLHVWNPQDHGLASHLPEQTHNEILQAATDYGILGAGGILALLGWLSMRGLWHSKFDDEKPIEKSTSADALRLGGMAALAGMLVQSSFSFVFHLLPGAMLLGIALGRLATPATQSASINRTGRIANAALALMIAAAIISPGIAGTRATLALMPVYFRIGPEPDENERLERFSAAIEAWPQSDLHLSRAKIRHHAIARDHANLALALEDYRAAASHNPKFPAHYVNIANLLSIAGDDDQAEHYFQHAIELQGNMEPAFRAHFHYAAHLLRKGSRYLANRDPHRALQVMESALENIIEVERKSAWISGDLREDFLKTRDAIYLGVAHAKEANGDFRGARATLDALLAIPGGYRYRYYRGMLEFRQAMAVWRQRRPEDALPLFRNARNHLAGAQTHPPHGISRETIREQIEEIDETLKLLHEAGFRQP